MSNRQYVTAEKSTHDLTLQQQPEPAEAETTRPAQYDPLAWVAPGIIQIGRHFAGEKPELRSWPVGRGFAVRARDIPREAKARVASEGISGN